MPNLRELQAADISEGIKRLNTLQIKYGHYLSRLPRIQDELSAAISATNIDYQELSLTFESQMVKFVHFLSDYELLNSRIRNEPKFKEFMITAMNCTTLSTVDVVMGEYHRIKTIAEKSALQHQENERVESEIKRKKFEQENEIRRKENEREEYRRSVINKELSR